MIHVLKKKNVTDVSTYKPQCELKDDGRIAISKRIYCGYVRELIKCDRGQKAFYESVPCSNVMWMSEWYYCLLCISDVNLIYPRTPCLLVSLLIIWWFIFIGLSVRMIELCLSVNLCVSCLFVFFLWKTNKQTSKRRTNKVPSSPLGSQNPSDSDPTTRMKTQERIIFSLRKTYEILMMMMMMMMMMMIIIIYMPYIYHIRRSPMQVMWEGSWERCTCTGWMFLPGTNQVPIQA